MTRSRVASSLREDREKLNYFAIGMCVLLMNGSWLFMEEVLQGVKYNNTLAIACSVANSYTYCLIPWFLWRFLRTQSWASRIVKQDADQYTAEGAFSWRYYFLIGAPIALLSMTVRTLWYYSLKHTNAAANSTIYQTTCVWVYVLSMPILACKFDLIKALSLALCVGGTVIVTFTTVNSKEDGITQTVYGYVELVGSVLAYALFQVLVKKFATNPKDPHPQMNSLRFCGILGLYSLIYGPISILIADRSGLREFEFPHGKDLALILSNGVVDAIFTGACLICIRLADPTFTSVSTIIIVPLTVIADWIIHSYTPPGLAFLGMATIILGWVIYNWRDMKLKSLAEHEQSRPLLQSSTIQKDQEGNSEAPSKSDIL